MKIATESEFCVSMQSLLEHGKITQEEHDAILNYVCGIFDALDGIGITESDLR